MANHTSLGLLVLTISLMVSVTAYLASDGHSQDEPGNSKFNNQSSTISVRIDQLLSSYEMMGFSGAIIVEHEGRVVLRKGYGLSDRESRLTYTPDTFQDILSVTKSFTGAAILSLESMGKLNLEDPITKFFVDVPDDKKSITIHHLLTHQSGMEDILGPDDESIGRDHFVARAMRTPLRFEPGARYDYSNAGYSILGAIIEHVSGQGYEEFIRETLLAPAGMNATGYVLPSWDGKNFAYGYRDGKLFGRTIDQGWLPDGPGWNLRANGGLHSNVDDMHRWFSVVLKGNGPLDKDQIERWIEPHVRSSTFSSYGYGLRILESEWGQMITHSGGNPAFSSDFIWIPSQDFFLYLQGNNALARASQLSYELLDVAFDSSFDFPPLISVNPSADPSTSKELEGVYSSKSGTITMSSDDVRLIAVPRGQGAINALFNTEPATRKRLNEINNISENVVKGLQKGRYDALEGLVREGADASEFAQNIIKDIGRIGVLRSVEIVATFQNLPGTQFESYGGFITLAQLDFENSSDVLGLIWRDDGTFRGTVIRPGLSDLPSYVLIPVSDAEYTAVERRAPWHTANVVIRDECIELNEDRFCR